MRNRSVLDSENIGRLLFKLSLPAFLGMLVMSLYNVIDTIFVSYYVGPLGIAGLSIVFPLQMLSMGIGQMTGMGGASQISRLIGARNFSKAEHVLGNAISITVVISVLISITVLVNLDFWLRVMGASENILPYARDYMSIIIIGFVFQTLCMSMSALLNAEGNVRISMIGMIISAVMNIILCAIFVAALGMGVKGSALATVLAQITTLGYYLVYRLEGKGYLKIRVKNLLINWGIFKDILAIGVASLARTLAGSLSAVVMNRALILFGGDFAVATFGILNRILMFALMPGVVIGQGLQPILGFNYGARHYDRALKSIKIAMIAATSFSIVAFFILYFAPHAIIRIFTSDTEIIDMGQYAAKHIFLAIYLIGFLMVGSTIFQAIGKATQSFITAFARPALFQIPLIFILPTFWHLDGVWLAFPMTDFLTGVLTFILLVPQINKLRKMNREAQASSSSANMEIKVS
jgi:putative MATE family efflux protein